VGPRARAVTVPATGENGRVSTAADLGVDEILEALAAGAAHPLGPGVPVTQLDHALQTAALLAHRHPGDVELAVAGLVHDVGHLLPGGSDATHAEDAARAVRSTLGARVAGVVALHVEAKRYLVATEHRYGGALAADSVTSLRRQGGAMGGEELEAFRGAPWAEDAVTLRRADDGAKAEGVVVRELAHWEPILRKLSGAQPETARG
jgi:predicted HD phosphohydrolase